MLGNRKKYLLLLFICILLFITVYLLKFRIRTGEDLFYNSNVSFIQLAVLDSGDGDYPDVELNESESRKILDIFEKSSLEQVYNIYNSYSIVNTEAPYKLSGGGNDTWYSIIFYDEDGYFTVRKAVKKGSKYKHTKQIFIMDEDSFKELIDEFNLMLGRRSISNET